MTWAQAIDPAETSPNGVVVLADPRSRFALLRDARTAGLLLVEVPGPGPALRGRLALLVEGAIEEALERRGAAPPGVGASSDLDASLSDQLYRARLVGAPGVAIAFSSLEGIANLAGALDAEDSAVLRWWLAAAHERPVRLVFDEGDRYLGVYAAPTSLSALLEGAQSSEFESEHAAPNPAPELLASLAAMDVSQPPPVVAVLPTECAVEAPEAEPGDPVARAEAEPAECAEAPGAEPAAASEEVVADAGEGGTDEAAARKDGATQEPAADEPEPESRPEPRLSEVDTATLLADLDRALESSPHVPEPAAENVPLRRRPFDAAELEQCQGWISELEGARGPKALAAIERMFTSAYVPLSEAVSHGFDSKRAKETLATWSASFAKSYEEAFAALKVRGKRPVMVLDVPDIALRMGRLHGARSVQLVLVDGMRFDLGLRMQERLKTLLGQRTALTERLLLWSALPTTTAVQLELLGRGPEGLRELASAPEVDAPVARGRSAATLRRVRAGHRELFKLDVVESQLGDPGDDLLDRLDGLASETADALASHMLRLPPRTLVVTFGDHGFAMDTIGFGTAPARRGGASPEEVLVPAFVWLVGAMH